MVTSGPPGYRPACAPISTCERWCCQARVRGVLPPRMYARARLTAAGGASAECPRLASKSVESLRNLAEIVAPISACACSFCQWLSWPPHPQPLPATAGEGSYRRHPRQHSCSLALWERAGLRAHHDSITKARRHPRCCRAARGARMTMALPAADADAVRPRSQLHVDTAENARLQWA